MNICDGGVIVMREWMGWGRFLEHIIVELKVEPYFELPWLG